MAGALIASQPRDSRITFHDPMAWRAIAEADLLLVLSGTELEAYRDAALATAQADPVAGTITLVTDYVRGYVAASGRYVMGATGVPESLIGPACDIVAFRIPARVGQDAAESRKTLAERAEAMLRDVRDGKFGLPEPTIADTALQSAPTPRMTAKNLTFTRAKSDGL